MSHKSQEKFNDVPASFIIISFEGASFPDSWVALLRSGHPGCQLQMCKDPTELLESLKTYPSSVVIAQTIHDRDLKQIQKLLPALSKLNEVLNFKLLLLNNVESYPSQRRISEVDFMDIAQLPLSEKAFFHKVDQLSKIVRSQPGVGVRPSIGEHIALREEQSAPEPTHLPILPEWETQITPQFEVETSTKKAPARDAIIVCESTAQSEDAAHLFELSRKLELGFIANPGSPELSAWVKTQAKCERFCSTYESSGSSSTWALVDEPEAEGQIAESGFCRKFGAIPERLLLQVFEQKREKKPRPMRSFFEETVKVEMVKIKGPAQRKAIVEALGAFFAKKGLHARVTRVLAQVSEELLLHTGLGFVPPVNESGQQEKEPYLELLANDHYVALGVLGNFEPMMQADWKKKFAQGTEEFMGLRLALGAGLSVMVTAPGKGQPTQIAIFCPRSSRYTEFKRGFQFWTMI
jgi:hypothetical protein